MNIGLRDLLVKLMRETADKIDAGNCEMTETEAMDLIGVISHQSMSKEQAYTYLNIKESKFDNLVREGKLPKGKKVLGFKEKRWYKDEIDDASRGIKHKR